MIAQIIPLHKATMGPNYQLADRLQQVGIDPHHIKDPNIVDPQLICHALEAMVGYTTDEASRIRLADAKNHQRFRFAIERDDDDAECLGYRPQLLVDPRDSSRLDDVLSVQVNPRAIQRIVEPVVSLARANDIVSEHDPYDENYAKVVKVAVSSTLALALSYSVFCEFGKFDTKQPFEPCVELEAIAEESGIEIDESEPAGTWLREVGLRFAGGVAMRYTAKLAASEFERADDLAPLEDVTLLYGMTLRSIALNMALRNKVSNERSAERAVSYAIERAYSPKQLTRISNLWFRVPTDI